MRALASLRTCGAITPIKNADVIETAHVDGWTCVVKKGEFKPGDTGIYFEIDSFLPADDDRYAFLAKDFRDFKDPNDNFTLVRGARLRTMTLRKQLSQGLFLPLSSFPELADVLVGTDVTEILGIRKWEAPIPNELEGSVLGALPSYIKTTDQERIQNLMTVLDTDIIGRTFEKSIKLDGTSMTVYFSNRTVEAGHVGVCGRNWEYARGNHFTLGGFIKRGEWWKAFKALFQWKKYAEKEDNTYFKVADDLNLIEALRDYGRNIAVQGELVGPGIQGNVELMKDHEFYIFDVWDIDDHRYLSPVEREDLIQDLEAHAAGDLKQVPVLESTTFLVDTTVESILATADGPSINQPKREGVVYKRDDGKFSFKAISNSYLMAETD